MRQYLNEGGANVIFRFMPYGNAEIPTALQRKILRLRKQISGSTAVGSQQILHNFGREWQPLFPPEHLVEHELVAFRSPVLEDLNASLRSTARAASRVDDVLSVQDYGLLITDMTPGTGERLLELKPKWLAQSPDAPLDAKRCRTCALRAQRIAAQAVITATDVQMICPLSLVSDSLEERRGAAARLTDDDRLRDYLMNAALPLLQTLRHHQTTLHPDDAARDGAEYVHNLCKAMTLRDCTLFLLKRSDGSVEARLGDLDMKHPDKVAKWEETERKLLEGGWYDGRDEICLLSRTG